MKVYQCRCGMRTTDPFVIDGEHLCAICAEEVNPRIVNQRARENYSKYTKPERHFLAVRKMMDA